jgi:hypothetical protein
MSTHYELHLHNDSLQSGDFCIFQTMPDINMSNVTSLAWLSKTASPTTRLVFQWALEYDFVWTCATGNKPGARVTACQSWPANTETNNKVLLDKINGAYSFSKQPVSESSGSLIIEQGKNVLPQEVSVGIGMDGKGTFVLPSQPNMQVMMTPKPAYWLCFGSFEQGQVIDISRVSQRALKLDFIGQTQMSVSFGIDNCWAVN